MCDSNSSYPPLSVPWLQVTGGIVAGHRRGAHMIGNEMRRESLTIRSRFPPQREAGRGLPRPPFGSQASKQGVTFQEDEPGSASVWEPENWVPADTSYRPYQPTPKCPPRLTAGMNQDLDNSPTVLYQL